MAGGLAGSVVVLVIKYIVEHYDFEIVYFGIANVIANGLIMLRWVFSIFQRVVSLVLGLGTETDCYYLCIVQLCYG